MARTIKFAGDNMQVNDDPVFGPTWSLNGDQVEKHGVMFDAEIAALAPAEKAKADALKAKFK